MDIIQNLITIVGSDQPFCSKWWCNGAILKILLPVVLNEITWIITEIVSSTNSPPIITKISSCFDTIAIAPKVPPTDNEPVSPMKTIAGGALNHKNPNPEPMRAAHIITNSPVPGTNGIFK